MGKPIAVTLLAVVGAAALVLQGRPADPPSPAADGITFDAFRILTQRNIFDPNRRAWRPEPRRTPAPRRQLPSSERIALTGVLIHDAGSSRTSMAYFAGSRSDYSGVLRSGETIGGLRLVAVRTDCVFLEGAGRRINLPVGSALTRRGNDPWQVVAGVSQPEGSSAYMSSDRSDGGPAASGSSASASGDAASDSVLKQLMERRRREEGGRGPAPSEGGTDATQPDDVSQEDLDIVRDISDALAESDDATTEPSDASAEPGNASAEPSDASSNDVLRRLMERRRQETNR